MDAFTVDTGELISHGARLTALDGSLGEACTQFSAVQGASGAAGLGEVDSAIDELVQRWGVTVVALQQAAVGLGLGLGAVAAAAAYDETDSTVIGP